MPRRSGLPRKPAGGRLGRGRTTETLGRHRRQWRGRYTDKIHLGPLPGFAASTTPAAESRGRHPLDTLLGLSRPGNSYAFSSSVADPVQVAGLLRKHHAASARHAMPTTSRSKIGAPVKGSTDAPDVCDPLGLWTAAG